MDVAPLVRVDLVRTNDVPNLVVEHLCGRTRKSRQTGVLEILQELSHRNAERLRALEYLQSRECMNVDFGNGVLNCAQVAQIIEPGERPVNAALHAHLSRSLGPCLLGPAR